MDVKNLKIIIPAKPSELEVYAAQELAFFVRKIAGCHLGLVREYEPMANAFESFISLGETERFKKQFDFSNLKEQVGEDGFRIIMDEKRVFICGGAGQGTLYGVYGFLKKTFNLTFYTGEDYTFDAKPLEFFDLDYTDSPDLPMRAIGIGDVHIERRNPGIGDKTYVYRMRLRQMDEGWGINNHSYFRVLPPSTYYKDHPDWYDKEVRTLCYANQEMIKQYVENMKVIIENTPNDSLYMIGMEDNMTLCDCPKCNELLAKYDGNQVAVMLHFTNSVVNALNAWLKETYPERKVYFFAFAYNWAELPPVYRDDNGEFKLSFESLRPADNFGVLIACIHCNANYPLNDERNIVAIGKTYHSGKLIPAKDLYLGWSAVVKNIASWNYNLNFYDYICPCPMWNFLDNSTFKFLKSVGTIHSFLEAGCWERLANFAVMKIFCVSNLMWDNSLDLYSLIHQFMGVYYKGAEKELFDYFTYIHEHAKWLNDNVNRQMIFVHFDDEPNLQIMDKRFWPKEMLFKSLEFFDKALSNDLSDKVKDRVLHESLPVKYTLLSLYRDELDKEFVLDTINQMRENCIKMGVNEVQDFKPKSIYDNFDAWEKELI